MTAEERIKELEQEVARLRDVVLTLFREAEHDHQRQGMWMTLREALGYGHNTGGVHDRWEGAVRALLAEDGAAEEDYEACCDHDRIAGRDVICDLPLGHDGPHQMGGARWRRAEDGAA